MRGRLVSVNQLTIVVGMLVAQLLNWWLVRDLPAGASDEFIRSSWFGQHGWRWMFALTAAPSLLFLAGMYFVPESPRWLLKKGCSAEAAKTLARIGGESYTQAEISDVATNLTEAKSQSFRLADQLDPRLRKVFILGGAGDVPTVVRHQCDF